MEVQKSRKGADDIIMKRKIYQQLLDWKEKRNGEVALLIEGARRIGKSYIVEEFAKNVLPVIGGLQHDPLVESCCKGTQL